MKQLVGSSAVIDQSVTGFRFETKEPSPPTSILKIMSILVKKGDVTRAYGLEKTIPFARAGEFKDIKAGSFSISIRTDVDSWCLNTVTVFVSGNVDCKTGVISIEGRLEFAIPWVKGELDGFEVCDFEVMATYTVKNGRK